VSNQPDEQRGPDLPGLQFQRKLGSGGFSDVYLYEREQPRMKVAVKVLKADVMDEAQRAQFVAEADTMGELAEHPYIVPVLSAGTAADGRPYLEMRYYPGSDLAEKVRSQPLAVSEALRMGIQLASAIETAHRAGIIHRDIKPQNVLISSYGVPGLTDFGIAGRLGDAEEDDTNVGVSMPWSPPEVLTGTSNGSHASDVYSLGATIWNLLVGRSPFSIPGDDNSQRALFTRIVHSRPPMTGRADVPSSLERLLSQAMSKKPEHRPRSAMELARHLQRVEQELRLARTEIVVLEHSHDGRNLTEVVPEAGSMTPTATLPETNPGGPLSSERTTLRVPIRTDGSPPATGRSSAPTSRRPARADTGADPTTARPTRTSGGAAPTTARPARAQTPPAASAPTTHRPSRANTGAAPTTARPVRSGQPAAQTEQTTERRGIGTWIAVGVVGLLLVAAVGIGAMLSRGGGGQRPDPDATTQAPGASEGSEVIAGDLLPSPPQVRVAKSDNKSVTFAWDREQKGDTYAVQVVSRNGAVDSPWRQIDKTSVEVKRLEDGATCLQVFARRGSQSSASPGQTCTR
jgi:serine/threonine protein kinase